MEKIVYTLIKFASEEQHCLELQSGLLYMNRLKTFRNYRDADGLLRGDPYEGVVAIFQPDQVNIDFNG